MTTHKTTVPRWTTHPMPGTAAHELPVGEKLAAKVRRLAEDLRLPLSTTLLAAHVKVLTELSGQFEVVTGYAAGRGDRPVSCRLATAAATWRALLADVRRVEADALAGSDPPFADLDQRPGTAVPAFETVVDAAGPATTPLGEAVFSVGLAGHGTGITLRLRYRTDALDAAAASRVAGYHLTALALMSENPDASHQQANLLSSAELDLQVHGMAGPRRELPARRAHQLFEEQVRRHPGAVAAVQGTTELSYGELNARANRIGRALLAHGLQREGVVAVVTERNLDWMAAVLGIFKSGGVYLPIEPHFPPDRVKTMLSRAGCSLVLTEPESAASVDEACRSLPGVAALHVAEAYRAAGDTGDLGIDVTPDQLAYIYFTSGSTGEPKGAMCEQTGMLNHLCAKIADLAIGSGDVVAQTAPQCFDISLWQLLSALVVGGRTVIVEQQVILDVERFVRAIVDARVTVVQVVPSYLEVVLSHLERNPRELRDLRYVCVTGEALKPELAARWFAARPGIGLMNAYGLTETSDDTNHEMLTCSSERVSLGRPIQNVHVYVLDEQLRPVPLGAPGEIAFSGVCVGRGYVNDPERTARVFLADPHREGERLYRSGDFGRWLPDGKLDFLGRRDQQVKVRGFRIEIPEIENALMRVPGVRDCVVVAVTPNGQSARLVGFYSAARPLDPVRLRERLAASLPGYMVPSVLHWQATLPLTGNGKVDRKTLAALAEENATTDQDRSVPCTPNEQRLAAAWASVLGLPRHQIGRWDSFFDLGGTSLSAVRLAVALDREVSLKDVTRHPVLAELARLLDGSTGPEPDLAESPMVKRRT